MIIYSLSFLQLRCHCGTPNAVSVVTPSGSRGEAVFAASTERSECEAISSLLQEFS
jgi:hypothetical protein